MRILYGVQATGNGHISRARAMANAFRALNVEVRWLFSGRPREQLFDMAPFGDYLHRRGLTFVTEDGRIRYRRTLRNTNLLQFRRDVRSLPMDEFNLVVTDFEPVSARAGRNAGVATIGIGNQYAFGSATPTPSGHWLARKLMHYFAPVERGIGLHWHPYADTVLPPILHLPALDTQPQGHILVYLPFENARHINSLLQQFPQHQFELFGPGIEATRAGNVRQHPAQVEAFKRALASCSGVICNSGFELISECLQWRKPVLTRPLRGQLEQLANALSLSELGYATVAPELTRESLGAWLTQPPLPPALHFPNVAGVLAQWLANGARDEPVLLHQKLWGRTRRPIETPPIRLGNQVAIG